MATPRGMHKVEFYSSLDEIKELYDQGHVVLKILYEEMKNRKNWEMSYWSFLKYAKRELPLKKSTKCRRRSHMDTAPELMWTVRRSTCGHPAGAYVDT